MFLEGNEKGAFTFALKPVVSDPIFDKSKFIIFKNRLFWSLFGEFFVKSMQEKTMAETEIVKRNP